MILVMNLKLQDLNNNQFNNLLINLNQIKIKLQIHLKIIQKFQFKIKNKILQMKFLLIII